MELSDRRTTHFRPPAAQLEIVPAFRSLVTAALDETSRLDEIARQMERYVEHQVRASEELDDKIEAILTVELALAGGGIALAQAIHPTFGLPFDIRSWSAMVVGVGFAALSLSAVIVLHAYVGLTSNSAPKIDPGVDPQWLAAIAQDGTWTRDHIAHATIKGLRDRSISNQAELARVGRLRRSSIYLAISGLAFYACGSLMWFKA